MKKLSVLELNRISVDEFKQAKKTPLVVVVDNVRSMYNIGAIFRTSDAFLVEKIILCGITATPPHPEIHKSALGAEDTVEWEYQTSSVEAVRLLKRSGYYVFALEQVEDSKKLDEKDIIKNHDKIAIVVGNEVKGVTQETADECDDALEIPQSGTKHSLNVSVATGIAIWQLTNLLKDR